MENTQSIIQSQTVESPVEKVAKARRQSKSFGLVKLDVDSVDENGRIKIPPLCYTIHKLFLAYYVGKENRVSAAAFYQLHNISPRELRHYNAIITSRYTVFQQMIVSDGRGYYIPTADELDASINALAKRLDAQAKKMLSRKNDLDNRRIHHNQFKLTFTEHEKPIYQMAK